MPKVKVEGRNEVYRFPDDTPREEIARQLRNHLYPRRNQSTAADTAAVAGSTAGLFAPGAGVADALGVFPTGEGTTYPSMLENILSGNFADAGYQALGVVGDISYATAPVTGPVGVGIGMAAKAPRAARAAQTGLRGIADTISRAVDEAAAGRATPEDLVAAASRSEVPAGAPLSWRQAEYQEAHNALLSRTVQRQRELDEATSAAGVPRYIHTPGRAAPTEITQNPRLSAIYEDLRVSQEGYEQLRETTGREIRRLEALPTRLNNAKGKVVSDEVTATLYGQEAERIRGVLEQMRPTGRPGGLEDIVFEQSFITSPLLGNAPIRTPREMREAVGKLESFADSYRQASVRAREEMSAIEELIRNSPYRID